MALLESVASPFCDIKREDTIEPFRESLRAVGILGHLHLEYWLI